MASSIRTVINTFRCGLLGTVIPTVNSRPQLPMSTFDYYNGKFIPSGSPVVSADSRALRYGDGLFETLKLIGNQLLLADSHFDRLFHGLSLLHFDLPQYFTREFLTGLILQLCKKNNTEKAARIRLSILRGNGGPFDPENMLPQLLIQCWPLPSHALSLNEHGWQIGIYPEARKSCDVFANLKSNNYQPYLLAAHFAKRNQLDEAVLLNVWGRICDASIANIAWIKNGTIFTPPLSEGCVAGVMRRHLLEHCELVTGIRMIEQAGTAEDLAQADEIFLTNAINGIRKVSRLGGKQYQHPLTTQLYDQLIRPMHQA
ncbi:MAG: aminotransferase class IV [Chitinophagaceae bacterium]|nr:aminotransferase class IV [Chitinophagaceae bacterium]